MILRSPPSRSAAGAEATCPRLRHRSSAARTSSARSPALLHEHRLVTLTGPPGVGKSRLAVETARSLEACVPRRHLARRLHARGSGGRCRPAARKRDRRARRRPAHARGVAPSERGALLVLDACEHVLDEAARIASTLLAECPRLRILATSREALRIAGEVRLPVAPLGVGGSRPLPRACARGTARVRAGRRGRCARGGDRAARGRVAARDRARRCARERARACGARLDPRAPRGAPARQPGIRPEPYRAARARRMELRPPARRREDAAPAARRPPRRRVAGVARRGRSDARPQRGDRRLSRFRPGRQVDRVGFVLGRRRPLRHARHRPRVRARTSRRERRARTPPAAPTPSTSPRSPRRRGAGCAGREWLAWQRRLELENDNLWAALALRARSARPGASQFASARSGGTSRWSERVSEGRRFLELAMDVNGDDVPVEMRVELLAVLCFLATEELDLDAALAAGERALALAAAAAAPRPLGTRTICSRARARAIRGRGAGRGNGASSGRDARGGG